MVYSKFLISGPVPTKNPYIFTSSSSKFLALDPDWEKNEYFEFGTYEEALAFVTPKRFQTRG